LKINSTIIRPAISRVGRVEGLPLKPDNNNASEPLDSAASFDRLRNRLYPIYKLSAYLREMFRYRAKRIDLKNTDFHLCFPI
jgi:hypothetical protein